MRVKGWRRLGVGILLGLAIGLGLTATAHAGEKEDFFAADKEARALYANADYAGAAAGYERALALAQRVFGPDATRTAATLDSLAIMYYMMGQYAKAEPLLQRSLKIEEAKLEPDHPDIAGTLNNLAMLYQAMGQYAKAEPLYQRSLKIEEAKLEPDHPDIAGTLNNLAALYYAMGQYAKAEPLFQRSLKIYEARLEPDHPLIAARLNNLAALYKMMGQYAKAEPLFQRGLKIQEAKLEPDHPAIAHSLNNLADLYKEMGQYVKAEPLFERALKISEAKLGPNHPDVAAELNNLAALYYAMGQNAKAEPLYQLSLKIKEANFGPDHPYIAASLNNLASLHATIGERDEAAAEFDRERRGVRRHVASVLPALSEKEQLTFLERTDQTHWHVALSHGRANPAAPAIAAQSAGWLLNGKAVAHEAIARQKLLVQDSRDPAVAAKAAELRAVQSQLAGLSQALPKQGAEAAHRRRLAELLAQQQELARQVSVAAGRPALDQAWIEPDTARRALPADGLLVDIVRFRPAIFGAKGTEKHWEPARYVAWVTPPVGRGEIEVVDLGPAEAIDDAVARVRAGVAAAMPSPGQPGLIAEQGEPEAAAALEKPLGELAGLVLTPIVKRAGGARQLILSPDAELWLAPWAALPLDDGRFAIEEYEIRYVVSGRDLVAKQSAGLSAGKLGVSAPVMMADPNFDLNPAEARSATRAVLRAAAPPAGDPATRSISREGTLIGRAAPLPGTADEARAVRPKLAAFAHAEPTLYEKQYALEAVFKAVQRPSAVVMSTHGFFLPDQEAAPDDTARGAGAAGAAGESSGRAPAFEAQGRPLENPLLRCGLLLAGCNSRDQATDGNDGVLTGLEIVETDLRGTRLVVLSACETGLGEVHSGEGVAGLRQALQLAGAEAVVATLWQIPDQQSATLMSDFFTNLAAGASKATALRDAQLAMIAARRAKHGAAHPFFWAAFTLTGE